MKNNIKSELISISVVIPVYGCPESLPALNSRLTAILEKLVPAFEIILINDACPRNSWEIIKNSALHDKRIKGINLSRNFGQHNAITAGLDIAKGEWIVIMDCDLQDKPEEIPALYEKALEGYDIVTGRRVKRHDSRLTKIRSKVFYAVLGFLTDTKIDSSICNFGIYRKTVTDAIKTMREELRFFPALIRWVGFKTASINIDHADRTSGKSGYTFKKLWGLAINTMLAFSDKPLRITVQLGGFISLGSFLFALYIIFRAIFIHVPVLGWASLMVSVWLLSGLIIMILGIIGIYLGKTFSQVKNRPLYIIMEALNND